MNQFEKTPEVRIIPQPTLELTKEEQKARIERSEAHFARLAAQATAEEGQEKRPPTILGGPLYLAPNNSGQGELDLEPEDQKLF